MTTLPHLSTTEPTSQGMSEQEGVRQSRHLLETQPWVPAQVPQLTVPPQPSLTEPQVLPEQAFGFGVQDLHTLAVQVVPAAQVPQLMVLPQSVTVPQFLPKQAFGFGVQQVLAVQRLEPEQAPQLTVPPQPSLTVPQFLPAQTLPMGTQATQVLFVQVVPAAQVPQLMLPQLLATVPQVLVPQASAFVWQVTH